MTISGASRNVSIEAHSAQSGASILPAWDRPPPIMMRSTTVSAAWVSESGESPHGGPPHVGGHRVGATKLDGLAPMSSLVAWKYRRADASRRRVDLQTPTRAAPTGLPGKVGVCPTSGAEGRTAPQGVAEHEGNGNTGADRHHGEGGSPASRTGVPPARPAARPSCMRAGGTPAAFLDSAGELNATQPRFAAYTTVQLSLIDEAGKRPTLTSPGWA